MRKYLALSAGYFFACWPRKLYNIDIQIKI